MTHEFVPSAQPLEEEAVVRKRTVTFDAEKLGPKEIDTIQRLIESRSELEHEEQVRYLGGLAVNTAGVITANLSKEDKKREIVVENLIKTTRVQVPQATPEEHQALIHEVLDRLDEFGTEIVDRNIIDTIEARDLELAQLRAQHERDQQLLTQQQEATELARLAFLARYDGNAEVTADFEECFEKLEHPAEIPEVAVEATHRLTTEELEEMVSHETVSPPRGVSLHTLKDLASRALSSLVHRATDEHDVVDHTPIDAYRMHHIVR